MLVEPGPTESGFFDVKWWGKRELPAYTPLNARLKELQASVKDKCVPVGVVVTAVVAALTDRKPAFRIPTGTNTKMQLFAKSSLPERWWRGLVQKAVRFPEQD